MSTNSIFAFALRLVVVLTVGSMCLTADAGTLPYAELLWKGKALPFYGRPSDPEQQKIIDVASNAGAAERLATMVNAGVHLRQDLGVGFASCGNPNAFYAPDRRAIIICSELLQLIIEAIRSDERTAAFTREKWATWFDAILYGVFFHELGHALISINNVPVTGREEDVADQFAFYVAHNHIDPSKYPVINATVWFYRYLAKSRDVSALNPEQLRTVLANEHSLDEVRLYNLACWAVGGDPARGQAAATFVQLPDERRQHCAAEFGRLRTGITEQFKHSLKRSRAQP